VSGLNKSVHQKRHQRLQKRRYLGEWPSQECASEEAPEASEEALFR